MTSSAGIGGADAGRPDGGGAGQGASSSVGGGMSDGGAPDASLDAGCVPTPGVPLVPPGIQPPAGWHPWPRTPVDCIIFAPDDVSTVMPMTWETCPFMPDGCTRATAPWAQTIHFGYGGLLSVVVAAGRTYLAVGREVKDPTLGVGFETIVVRDQQIIAAAREYPDTGTCLLSGPTFDQDGTGNMLLLRDQAEYWPYVFFGKIETLMTAPEHTDLFGPPCATIDPDGVVYRSDRLLVVEGQNGVFTVRDLQTQKQWRPISGPPNYFPQYEPAPVGDSVFSWLYTSNLDSIWVWNAKTGTQPLLQDSTYSYDAFVTDGTQAAWVRSSGYIAPGTFQTSELWTSPIATTLAKMTPKKIATLPTQAISPLAIRDGWIAAMVSWTDMRMYRISDGQERFVPAGPGLAYPGLGQNDGVNIAGGALWLKTCYSSGAANDIRFITRFDIEKLPLGRAAPVVLGDAGP